MNAHLAMTNETNAPHYELIEAAMAWLADMRAEQPSLEELLMNTSKQFL